MYKLYLSDGFVEYYTGGTESSEVDKEGYAESLVIRHSTNDPPTGICHKLMV